MQDELADINPRSINGPSQSNKNRPCRQQGELPACDERGDLHSYDGARLGTWKQHPSMHDAAFVRRVRRIRASP